MKSKIGLYLSVFAVILTFVLTRGKIITGNVLFRRLLINAGVFYALGLGLEKMYHLFFVPLMHKEDAEDESGESVGRSLDATVGEEDDGSPLQPVAEGDEEIAGSLQNNEQEPYDPGQDAPSRPPYDPDQKVRVKGDYIYFDDKKMPNDAKLMAEAIKTKLAEE